MDIFNGDLESIEEFCFCILNFSNEVLGQVFIDYSVAGSKEGQNMSDKMPFTVVEVFPVF